MRLIFILILQFITLHLIQAQLFTVNDVAGEYSYPSITEEAENVFLIHNGKAFYYPQSEGIWSSLVGSSLVNIVYDFQVGRYELSDSIIRVFKDSLSSKVLYEFKVLDSLNLVVLFSANETIKQGAYFHRQSSYFEFENKDYPFMTRYPWRISRKDKWLNAFEDYRCEYWSVKAERPDGGYFYKRDSTKTLPSSIYKPNTLIERDE